jgi:hypothetical protein
MPVDLISFVEKREEKEGGLTKTGHDPEDRRDEKVRE